MHAAALHLITMTWYGLVKLHYCCSELGEAGFYDARVNNMTPNVFKNAKYRHLKNNVAATIE